MLADLGVRSVRLLSNNPEKEAGLAEHGVIVRDRVPLSGVATAHNVRYLRAKRDRLHHSIDTVDPVLEPATS